MAGFVLQAELVQQQWQRSWLFDRSEETLGEHC
jgi:hypothetical protein